MKEHTARSVEQGAVSGDLAQGSGAPVGGSLLCTLYSPPVTRHSARRTGGAFTLIELLIVVAIIAILAGLTLSTLGYVNKKAARSRAEAEVAALSTAIESYKLDFGGYPTSNNLYKELTGQGQLNTNKVFFEPTAQITTNTATGPFTDPWGEVYNYEPTNPTINVGFFDLWTKAGETTNTNSYIRN